MATQPIGELVRKTQDQVIQAKIERLEKQLGEKLLPFEDWTLRELSYFVETGRFPPRVIHAGQESSYG